MEEENKNALILLLENFPKESLVESSDKFETINEIINSGNSTLLLRRSPCTFMESLLSVDEFEKLSAEDKLLEDQEQSQFETDFYNKKIKGDHLNIFKGLNVRYLTNDQKFHELATKYKLEGVLIKLCSNKEENLELLESHLEAFNSMENKIPSGQEDSQVKLPKAFVSLMHLNWDPLNSQSPPSAAFPQDCLSLCNSILKPRFQTHRLSLGLLPLQITGPSILKPEIPSHPSDTDSERKIKDLINDIIPLQTYEFYKSDKINDVCVTEACVMIEYEDNYCRTDYFNNLKQILLMNKVFANRYILATHYLKTIAFRLGFVGKFGA